MRLASYILLFVIIQAAALMLTLLGLPLIVYFAYFYPYVRLTRSSVNGRAILHFGKKWMWLWDNEVDGIDGGGGWNQQWSVGRRIFTWSALRNPCNNLRFVKGVSAVGRPLWRKTWGAKPGGLYVSAGWNNSGYPVLSGGRNVNPY